MKTQIFLPLFILFSCYFGSAAAQTAPNKTDASGKKQGHWIKLDDNHKKMYDGNFVDNNPVGKFTYYYDTGIPWAITQFQENGKVAYTKTYDAGGKITGEGKYINQKKDSVWKFYNDEEKIISDETYSNGLKNGNCHVYYHSGQIAEEKMWKDGKPNGAWKKYFESGQLKYNGFTVNDKVQGKTTFYYPSGQVEGEGMYKEDVKDGEWKYYTEEGKIKRIDTFIMGRQTNKVKDYIDKQEEEKQKQQNENIEIKDPFQEGYTPK